MRRSLAPLRSEPLRSGAVQHHPGQVDVAQVFIGQDTTFALGAAGVHPHLVGLQGVLNALAEVPGGAGQAGAAGHRPFDIGAIQVGAGEIGVAEGRIAQVRHFQVRVTQVRARQVGAR